MATNDKDFKVKNGLIVGNSTNLVNYTSSSPSNPFLGQLWISASSLYAWSGTIWNLIGDGNSGGGGSASGTPLNIHDTLVARSASGSFQIGAVDFHTASPVVSAVGRMTWSDGEGTVSLGLKGGNINLPIGQEEIALCYNGTGSTIPKGTVVYISGAQGQRPRISLSNASTESTSTKTFGLASEQILDGQEGYVTTFGTVSNIDTSSFGEGDALWLSASSGKVTNIMPTQPYHGVFIGYCLKSAPSSGRIFVKVQNGYELQELHNVFISSLNDKEIISYSQSASLWVNKNLATAITEVDGVGSGIDADLLDGHHASYFLNTSSAVQETWGHFTFHDTVTIGNLVVTGSATYINAADLSITDSIIYLASQQFNSDSLDIGIFGAYGDPSPGHHHTGLVRDASDGIWKLFSNAGEPSNSLVDFSGVTYDTLQLGTIIVSSSVVVSNLNSDYLDGYHSGHFLAAETASSVYLTQANASATYVTQQEFRNIQIAVVMGIY